MTRGRLQKGAEEEKEEEEKDEAKGTAAVEKPMWNSQCGESGFLFSCGV